MIPDDLFDSLNAGARLAVATAWLQTLVSVSTRDEVDHLYLMTTVGTEMLGQQWAPVLAARHIALRVTGVFCHLRPRAHFTHPVLGACKPELADLLVVHQHTAHLKGGHQQVTRRAVLVQAKMVDRGVPGSGSVDPAQDYLYRSWPDFELRGCGPTGQSFVSGPRDLRPQGWHGRYGLIERSLQIGAKPVIPPYSLAFPWTFCRPRGPVRTAGGEDAGQFLASMLYWTSPPRGRTADLPVYPLALTGSGHRNNHFDVTVEELLTLTAQKTVYYKKRPHLRGPRGYSVFMCLQASNGLDGLLSDLGQRFAPSESVPPPPGLEVAEDEFDAGIPTILIETAAESRAERSFANRSARG